MNILYFQTYTNSLIIAIYKCDHLHTSLTQFEKFYFVICEFQKREVGEASR